MQRDNPPSDDGRDARTYRTVPLSRRQFIEAAGAGALALGTVGSASAATKVEETCASMDEVYVPNGDFKVINNDWSATSATMCSYVYDDGSYGWRWDRNGTSASNPNYPQSLIGHKPWGTATPADQYPIKRGNVNSLEMELDVTVNADKSQGEWNLTEEWWLMNSRPELGADKGSSITHEIMTVFEWSDSHNHGYPVEKAAFTDKYGNTFDYWTHYSIGWSFHIFRIQGNSAPSQVDFTPLVDYVSNNFGASGDLWMTGMEIGNEYWDYTNGDTRIYEYDVSVNGSKSSSGQSASRPERNAPRAPSNLSSPSDSSSAVDLAWDASSSSDVHSYRIWVDGAQDHVVSASATSTSVASVSGGTCYDFHVTAIDDAGNESAASNTISINPGSGSCGSTSTETATATETETTSETSTSDGSVVFATNCGGSGYTASDGTYYQADANASGGSTYSVSDSIANTSDDALYQTERWNGSFSYDVPVSGGTYDVELHFAEIYHNSSGNRVFDVNVEGSQAVSNLDIYSRVGHDTALVETVSGVDVSDGTLTISFDASADNAKVSAIRILESSSSSTSDGDSTAPSGPSNLYSPGHGTGSVDLDWSGSSDSGGSGLSHYNVYVSGSKSHQVSAGTTRTTVSNLSASTSYEFSVTAVDGAGNESGSSNTIAVTTDSSADTTAPSAPSNLSSPSKSTSSVDLDWDASSDSGGSGLSGYDVFVDGGYDHSVGANTTSTTVDGLSSGTSYDFHVVASDGAGNTSSASNTVSVTTESDTSSDDGGTTSSGSLVLNDFEGDNGFGSNDLGGWMGSGSFQSSSISSGALHLDYNGGGWYQSYISRDLSGYSSLKMRIKGDSGGEGSHFQVDMGGVKDTLANLSGDSVGTSYSTVTVDMAAAGMDLGSVDDFYLNFWGGDYADGAIHVEKIWFE